MAWVASPFRTLAGACSGVHGIEGLVDDGSQDRDHGWAVVEHRRPFDADAICLGDLLHANVDIVEYLDMIGNKADGRDEQIAFTLMGQVRDQILDLWSQPGDAGLGRALVREHPALWGAVRVARPGVLLSHVAGDRMVRRAR